MINNKDKIKFGLFVILFALLTSIMMIENFDFNYKLILMTLLIFLTYYMIIKFKTPAYIYTLLMYLAGVVGMIVSSKFEYYHTNAVMAFQLSIIISITFLYAYVRNNDLINKQLYERTMVDDLTGIFNKRYYDIQLAKEVSKSKRYHNKFAIMLLDFDNFKEINDSKGHLYGDQLIKAVATEIHSIVRQEDTFCRFGGDEFVLILHNYNDDIERIIGDRVKDVVANINRRFGKDLIDPFSMSVGLSIYPDDTCNQEVLFHYADNAMYQAKKNTGTSLEWYSHIN